MNVACYRCGNQTERKDELGKRGVLCKPCASFSAKKRYHNNRKIIVERANKWVSDNRDRFNKNGRAKYLERKKKSIEMYGGKCNECGEKQEEFLVIDHVNDDGAIDRKKWSNKVSDIHRWVAKNNYPPNFQVLCGNCNLKKERNRIKNNAPKSEKIRSIRIEAKIKVFEMYGKTCKCCSEDDYDKLIIDHINGGGSKEKNSYPSRSVYLYLRDKEIDKDKFQILCQSCNQAKELKNGCPHKSMMPT